MDPAYRNTCVECQTSYLGADATRTYVIPLQPVAAQAASPVRLGGSGIAFDGILLDGPAPVDAILGAYTIAPFDDCGGHVNPQAGYHYHAVTDCLTEGAEAEADAHGTRIGLALDGYLILAGAAEPADLDACRGHDADGYHYHAGAPGSNEIVGCLSAQVGCVLDDPDAVCDASAASTGRPGAGPPSGGPPPPGPRPGRPSSRGLARRGDASTSPNPCGVGA